MSHLSRRHLLKAAAAAIPVTGSLLQAATGDHTLKTIGVQLYTVRNTITEDPAKVLHALDEIGYREAEVIGGSLEKIWPALKQTRLKPVSLHLDLPLFDTGKSDQLNTALAGAKSKGFEYVVYAYVPPAQRGKADVYKSLADRLNAAGKAAKAHGLQLCYHNHAFEYQEIEGGTPLQMILGQTDKDLLKLELDVFWVSVAGHDPVELLNKYAGRIPLIHLKDKAEGTPVQFNEGVPKTAFREVGKGTLKFPEILRAASSAGVKHYFVEQDQTPGDPVESLRESFQYLHNLKF